jgi:hypothetical protein
MRRFGHNSDGSRLMRLPTVYAGAPANGMFVCSHPVIEAFGMFMPLGIAVRPDLDMESRGLEQRPHVLVGCARVRAPPTDWADHERVPNDEVLVAERWDVYPEQQRGSLVRRQPHLFALLVKIEAARRFTQVNGLDETADELLSIRQPSHHLLVLSQRLVVICWDDNAIYM